MANPIINSTNPTFHVCRKTYKSFQYVNDMENLPSQHPTIFLTASRVSCRRCLTNMRVRIVSGFKLAPQSKIVSIQQSKPFISSQSTTFPAQWSPLFGRLQNICGTTEPLWYPEKLVIVVKHGARMCFHLNKASFEVAKWPEQRNDKNEMPVNATRPA